MLFRSAKPGGLEQFDNGDPAPLAALAPLEKIFIADREGQVIKIIDGMKAEAAELVIAELAKLRQKEKESAPY